MAAIFMLDMMHREITKKKRAKKAESQNVLGSVKAERIKLHKGNTCRVCLKRGSIPIFTEDSSQNIAAQIKLFADVKVTKEDTLPQYLCLKCHSLLQAAMLFRSQAQKADQRLRKSGSNKKVKSLKPMQDDPMAIDDDSRDEWNVEIEPKTETSTDPTPIHCKKCVLDFTNMKEYTLHLRSEEHKRQKRPCPECGVEIVGRYMPVHNARFHASVMPCVCEICGKGFPIVGALRRHVQTHNNNLPFKCAECPYRGRFRESLKLHMRVHTGERPYACDYCPSRFVNASNLKKHLQIHKNPDFKCEQCDRGFYSEHRLKEHLRVDHTGLKEHECVTCGKMFAYRKQMMKHSKKVHHRPKVCNGRLPLYMKFDMQQQNEENEGTGEDATITLHQLQASYKKQMMQHTKIVHRRRKMISGRQPLYLKLGKQCQGSGENQGTG